MTMRRFALLFTGLVMAGCTGLIGGEHDAGDRQPDASPTACEGVCIGENGMMRLTRTEYLHSVQAVFGEEVDIPLDQLPFDAAAGPFAANDTTASEADIVDYERVAWTVAAQLAPALANDCEASTCIDHLLDTYGVRLLRGTIPEESRARYRALMAWSLEEDDLVAAVELVVATLLQSPAFIYRVEPATDGTTTPLDGLAVATRLSLFLWRQGPDDALREAALAGELDTAKGIERHARRMLADPRADRAIGGFVRDWLDLEQLPLDEELAAAMRAETVRFTIDVFRKHEGQLQTLLTSDRATVLAPLAEHYGITPGEDVKIPGRVGILTHGAVMSRFASSTYTRPIQRGDMLLSRVLCRDLYGEIPDDAIEEAESGAEELADDLSDREKLDALTSGPRCSSCHDVINPAGFVFESFDEAGRFRTEDARGEPIDSSLTFEGMGDLDGDYGGPASFMARVADSDALAACLTKQWFQFGLARVGADDDHASLDALQGVLSATGDLREVMVAVATSQAFRHRRPRRP